MSPDPKEDLPIAGNEDVVRAVHRAKLELEQMIDLTPQVMLLVDPGGTITRTNLALLRMLGTSDFRTVLGKHLEECFAVEGASFFKDLLTMGSYGVREARTQVRPGHEHTFRYVVIGVGGGEGSCVIIIEDISPLKALAERDEKAHKTAAVRELAGALMHSINQRLTVINIRAKLILMAAEKPETFDPEKHKKSLHDIMDLSMEIADVLEGLEKQEDFVTVEYLKGIDIMDLERSRGK